MLAIHTVQCPYCGESITVNVDPSGGDQEYIEDCQVCCRPIEFHLSTSSGGDILHLEIQRDDE